MKKLLITFLGASFIFTNVYATTCFDAVKSYGQSMKSLGSWETSLSRVMESAANPNLPKEYKKDFQEQNAESLQMHAELVRKNEAILNGIAENCLPSPRIDLLEDEF